MNVLDKIEKKEIGDLLGKGWLTHDGMWFYHTYRQLGIEKDEYPEQSRYTIPCSY